MSKTLFINACVRENSRTLVLAGEVLSRLGGDFEEVKLYGLGLLPLDNAGMQERNAAALSRDFSHPRFSLARQFAAAETIVIAAPYWDLMFPAVLKLYLEAITVNGLVFSYNEHGIPEGLCRATRLIYVTTSGGPLIKNFGYDYVCALANSFYGIKDVRCISAQGLDIRGANPAAILEAAKAAIDL